MGKFKQFLLNENAQRLITAEIQLDKTGKIYLKINTYKDHAGTKAEFVLTRKGLDGFDGIVDHVRENITPFPIIMGRDSGRPQIVLSDYERQDESTVVKLLKFLLGHGFVLDEDVSNLKKFINLKLK